MIEAGRFPVVALYLDVPAEELDVNVHPARPSCASATPTRSAAW